MQLPRNYGRSLFAAVFGAEQADIRKLAIFAG